MYTKYQAFSIFLPCIVFSTWATSITAACVVYCGEEEKKIILQKREDIKMEGEEERKNNGNTLQTQLKVVMWLRGRGPLSERCSDLTLQGARQFRQEVHG